MDDADKSSSKRKDHSARNDLEGSKAARSEIEQTGEDVPSLIPVKEVKEATVQLVLLLAFAFSYMFSSYLCANF